MDKNITISRILPAPSSLFLQWLDRVLFLQNAIISGRSIPDLESGLQNLVLLLPPRDYKTICEHLDHAGTILAVTGFETRTNARILQIQIESQVWNCKLCIDQDSTIDSNNCSFEFQNFIFDQNKKYWIDHSKNIQAVFPKQLQFNDPNLFQKLQDVNFLLNTIISSAKMDLALDKDILNFIKKNIESIKNNFIAQEKIGPYLYEVVISKCPGRAFFLMRELDILKLFLPELDSGFGLSQNKYHKHDIADHCIYTCNAVSVPDPGIRFAALFHDIGKVPTRRIKSNGEASFYNHELVSTRLTRKIFNRTGLNEKHELLKRVIFLVRNHMFHYTNEWTDKAIRRFIQKINTDQLDDLIKLRLADRKGSGKRSSLPRAIKELIRHIEEVRIKEAQPKIRDLDISGHDLLKIGVKAGPIMGDILKLLLQEVKNGDLQNEFDTLMGRVGQLINNKNMIPGLKIAEPELYSGATR